MGRRSRRRQSAAATAAPARAGSARRERLGRDERPLPPWHPVPLVELSVLAGLILLAAGFFLRDGPLGRAMLICGLGLASLAGLDTALREHFSGYRSHSTLLAGLPAVATAGALLFAGAGPVIALAATAAVLALALVVLRRAFRARTGRTVRL